MMKPVSSFPFAAWIIVSKTYFKTPPKLVSLTTANEPKNEGGPLCLYVKIAS